MKNTKILSKKAIKCAIISLLLLSIGLCAVIAFSMGGGAPFWLNNPNDNSDSVAVQNTAYANDNTPPDIIQILARLRTALLIHLQIQAKFQDIGQALRPQTSLRLLSTISRITARRPIPL